MPLSSQSADGVCRDGLSAGRVMEWMPPSLTASQCAKLGVLQPKRMEGGIHEGS
jgi:hypothetical protein